MTTQPKSLLRPAETAATSFMQRHQTGLAGSAVLIALVAGAAFLRLWVALNHTM